MLPSVIFTAESRNSKTGPIPVTTTEAETCPVSCALQSLPANDPNRCYAKRGPLGMLWASMRNALIWDQFLSRVESLPLGTLWRHNQAGDLPHTNQTINATAVDRLVTANSGKRGFTYTHHDISIPGNADVIRGANARGFTINLSGNSMAHADELKALAIAPVVTVLPHDTTERKLTSPGGNTVIVCPATYRDDVSCGGGRVGATKAKNLPARDTKACALCARQRDVIIGFPGHGAPRRAKKA